MKEMQALIEAAAELNKRLRATNEALTQLALKHAETDRSKIIKGHRYPRNWHYKNKR